MNEPTTNRAKGQIRQAVALMRAAGLLVEEISPADASELAALFGEAERVAAAAALRCARRVGRGAAGLLATVTGTAQGTARRKLETAEAIETAPEIAAAFSRGELSSDQAQVLAPVAAAAPKDAGALLQAAKGSSLKELKAEAERTLRRRRSEEDEQERERRVHERRYCRAYPAAGGGVRLEALFGTADGALVMAALDKEADALFDERHKVGVHASRDHLLADALVNLVTGSARAKGAQVSVRVNAESLQRGEVQDGEVCEVPGVGPVSVETARRLVGEGFFTVLVKSGVDITTVTSTTRTVYRRVEVALHERDQTCVAPGCSATRGLQRHHWRQGYREFGPTELDNLCLVCTVHHDLVTKAGWKLLGGPGKWKLYPPKPTRRSHGATPPANGPPAKSP